MCNAKKARLVFTVLFPGILTLVLSMMLQSARAEVKADKIYDYSLAELGKIQVITASGRMQELMEAPATIYVITEDDIKQYGYRDLKDVLQHIPGIEYAFPQSHIEGGQRGFPGAWSQTKILINGHEANSLFGGGAYVASQYTLNNVKQVEIIQGPASALYGAEAFTGVINIITKNSENTEKSSDFSFALGSMDKLMDNRQFSFNHIAAKKNLGINLSGTIFNQEGPDFTDYIRTAQYAHANRQLRNDMLDSLNPYRDDDRAINANADLVYTINDNSSIKTGIYFLRDKDGGGIENPEISYTNFDMIVEQTLTYLTYEKDYSYIPGKLIINMFRGDQTNLIRFQNRADEGAPPPYLAVFNVENSKLHKINLQIDISPKFISNYLIAGFGYHSLNTGEPAFTGVSIKDSTLGNPMVGKYLYPPKGYFSKLRPYLDQNKTYAYLQDQQSFFDDKLQIILGGRFDYHNIYGSITNIRSGLYYHLAKGWAIKGLYGEAFREPTIFELSDNSNLNPAEMQTWELSLHFNPKKNISGQAVYYWNHASKIIQEQRGTTGRGGKPVNIGEKEVQGLESLIKWHYKKFKGHIWYNFERNPDDQDFLNVAKNKLGAGVSYNIMKNLSVSLQGKYTDEIKTNALDGNGDNSVITIPEYGSYNFTLLAHRLHLPNLPEIDLSFSIYNLLDERNLYPNLRGPNPSSYLAEGRSFFVNAGVSF